MAKDIPLDQAVKIVRAAQKLNCDTDEELFRSLSNADQYGHFHWFWLKQVSELPEGATIADARKLATKALREGARLPRGKTMSRYERERRSRR